MNRMILILVAVLLLLNFSPAQESKTGSIRGVVSDAESGEPLIGVNLLVMGTYLGASTDVDGFYIIPDVPAGEYTLEATYIGYKVIRQTGVRVSDGEKLTLNLKMESTALALGQDIVVIGEKPLIEMDQTGTTRSVSGDDISNQIFDDVKTVVATQVGIVEQDDEIHIRGGRSYEAQYMLDGISVQDPLSGTGFGLNISANAIDEVEVITGGFQAEYGQATSGIINVKTKTGTDKFQGFLSYKSDHLGMFRNRPWSFNSDVVEFNLGGPELISGALRRMGINLPGKLYFFANFYSQIADDYTRRTADQLYSSIAPTLDLFGNEVLTPTTLAPRQNNSWSGLFKLTYELSPTQLLTFSYNRSIAINQNTQSLQTNLEYVEPGPGFPYAFSKNLDLFNTYTHDNEQLSLHWQHTLNKTTFYEVRLSQYWAHLRSDWNGHHWTDYRLHIDVPRLPVQYYTPGTDPTKIRIIPGDGFYDYGNAASWHDHFIEWYTLKADVTSNYRKIHNLKAGIEMSVKEMQMVDIIDPWWEGGFGTSQDIYRVYPADGALYAQDNIKFQGFYLNAGVRLDYWMPGKLVDRAVADTSNILLTDAMRQKYEDESYKLFGHRVKLRLMPRLGVSHPISTNQMLFFNYGHFSKRPKPQFVYAKLAGANVKSAYQKFGNPSLNPETSVIYELGIRHKFTENDVISITGYYKDIFDYVQTTSIRTDPRIGSAIFYINLDYARSRGVEAEYKTRIGKYFSGNVNGSYSITTTKSSSPDVGLLLANGSIDEEPIKETFAVWDRPWQISVNMNYNVPSGKAPRIFGFKLPDNWNLNFRWFAMAGRRYTPVFFQYNDPLTSRPVYTRAEDQTLEYSKLGSYWQWADLSIKKYFNWFGLNYTFSVEVTNLFNRDNADIINSVTGRAYEYGDPTPLSWNDPLYPDLDYPISDPFPFNPARYKEPRQIMFGVSVEF